MSTPASQLAPAAGTARAETTLVQRIGLGAALAALLLIVITAAAMALLLVFALTYWPWMGYMTTGR